MKVLFVLPRMVSGGVERVTLNLISAFQASEHECALALRRAYGELLPEAQVSTRVHELAPRGMHQFVPRLAALIRSWQPTHVITAFSDVGALTWLALRFARSHARWVHGVHNTHARVTASAGSWGAARFWLDNRCAAFIYRRANAVVAVSDGVRQDILDNFHADPKKVVTIYNPVVSSDQLVPVQEPRHPSNQPFTIVALGRLTRQKGFDILIEAMREVPPPWRLDIWGEGEDRAMLELQIADAGLQAFIYLRGYTCDPYAVLRTADLFVLPSRWEGLPTVLVEALACQCQIVATDCPHGPREILHDGELGTLVPIGSRDVLAAAIRGSMACANQVPADALLARAHEFTQSKAGEKWLQILRCH